ncbi:hypothetical protein Q7C36_022434 [Tachysurus vachellii]|uniref:Uncharacterized protein n=1 Tax=Tachysurus vachellii TaxID=175792 RepID=A0AA88LNJ7_TACVA|nr:hypothetical protein Q7C36_022434 [Tachysurus vachellii]
MSIASADYFKRKLINLIALTTDHFTTIPGRISAPIHEVDTQINHSPSEGKISIFAVQGVDHGDFSAALNTPT